MHIKPHKARPQGEFRWPDSSFEFEFRVKVRATPSTPAPIRGVRVLFCGREIHDIFVWTYQCAELPSLKSIVGTQVAHLEFHFRNGANFKQLGNRSVRLIITSQKLQQQDMNRILFPWDWRMISWNERGYEIGMVRTQRNGRNFMKERPSLIDSCGWALNPEWNCHGVSWVTIESGLAIRLLVFRARAAWSN